MSTMKENPYCGVRRFALAKPECVIPIRHFNGVDYKNCSNCPVARHNLLAKVRKEQAEITKGPVAAAIDQLYIEYQARNGKNYKYSIINGESNLKEIVEIEMASPSDNLLPGFYDN